MLQVTRLGRFARFAPLLVGVGSAVALSAVPVAAASPSLAPPPVRDEDRARGGDHLTVTVRNAGGAADGTYEVDCHPGGGSHPDAGGACAVVERNTRWGKDAFAAVPGDSVCTMQYGGPATAHVTGTWAGRPVDARFDRSNGCEIGRWDRLVPLLPKVGRHA
ncbi:SSI family serine proteinase inhibitor [Streptomyces sp. NPDC058678]|uniref:SSI family serine proteinase inhibitor n=1 Tax=Streptomyces sp. NPDC058678 TaxID=3346595 RepID=UPI00366852A5